MKRNQRGWWPQVRAVSGRATFAAVGVLASAAAVTGAWPACDLHDDASGAGELDPGPTFGAEVVVTIFGRGRVSTSDSAAGVIDCPSKCFARVVLVDPHADGAPTNVTLRAEATDGAHFVEWKLDPIELGVRARGPAQCSPMTRRSEQDNGEGTGATSASLLRLRLGETKGTPPPGREAECAELTSVPIAYALTATFEEDFVPKLDSGVDAGIPPLFEPPAGVTGAAKEIGIVNGTVYWRFLQTDGTSGIAAGFSGGGGAIVITQPTQALDLVDIDRHVVFQDSSGRISAIEGGDTFTRVLAGSAQICGALASDANNVYCRTQATGGASSTTLLSWPINGAASAKIVYVLPRGNALAVDDSTARFYYSDENGVPAQGSVKSVPRNNNDSGVPFPTLLALSQTGVRSLAVGPSYLFWLDDRGGGVFAATSGSKFFQEVAEVSQSGQTVRFVAADPSANGTYWIGIFEPGAGGCSILRANVGTSSAPVFQAGITGLGGIAVDSSFVYWTESSGRVYRMPKNDFEL